MENMTDNLAENREITADTAEAEEENAAAVPPKFKDVKTLVKAYSELEAEFTRRSQRLKALEQGKKTEEKPDAAIPTSSPTSDEQLTKTVLANEKVRDAVISEYLKSISSAAEVPLVAGGGGVAAPRVAPKSISEAGKLAQQFLKG